MSRANHCAPHSCRSNLGNDDEPAITSALCAVFVLTTTDVFADDGSADAVIRELCQNGRTEGVYMQSFGNDTGYAFLICTSSSSMVAEVRSKNAYFDLTMAHTAINGDNLYFVTFDTSDDGARGALGNTPDPRLKLSISALRQGIMRGEYRSMILRKPVMVLASRSVGFPNLIPQANPAFDYRMITGRFVIDHIEQLKRVEAVAPAYVAIESIGPRLRVNLNDSGTIQYGLYNGIGAKDNVVYASSGVDDSLGGKNRFVHVRGYLVDENHLELFFFQSQYGMVGPISAHRDRDPF